MIKVGITGSLHWDDKIKVKNIIFKLKNQFKNELELTSRGQAYGVDKFVRKYCMEFDIDYKEIPLNHQQWNQHCVDNFNKFNQNYSVTNYFKQNKRFLDYCEIFIIYTTSLDDDLSAQQDLIKKIEKSGKKFMIIK